MTIIPGAVIEAAQGRNKVLERVLPHGGLHEVGVADLSPGVYILTLVSGGQSAAGRMVICR